MNKILGWIIGLISDLYDFLWRQSNSRAEKKINNMARVDAHAAVMARARLKKIRFVLKLVYCILIIFITGGTAVLLFIYAGDAVLGLINALLPGFFCLVTLYLLFFDKSGNISVLEATDVVRQKSPYALYLRAFQSDADRMTFNEEGLVQKLLQQKVVTYAVGLPEEIDSFPGAKRVYINNNTWQEEFRMMMNNATFIFLRICNTEPCLWEIRQALSLSKEIYIIIDNAEEYAAVSETVRELPQDIMLPLGTYMVFKRLSDGSWEKQETEEIEDEVTGDEAFMQAYVDGLLESYPMPSKESEYEYEKAIEGLLDNGMLGWEQQYIMPIAARIMDLLDAYYVAFGNSGDVFVSELAQIKIKDYLYRFNKIGPLEEDLFQRKKELFDKVEYV